MLLIAVFSLKFCIWNIKIFFYIFTSRPNLKKRKNYANFKFTDNTFTFQTTNIKHICAYYIVNSTQKWFVFYFFLIGPINNYMESSIAHGLYY